VSTTLARASTACRQPAANDDAEDLAQEEPDLRPVVAIAQTIAKKL
jgi:hypothetical protein